MISAVATGASSSPPLRNTARTALESTSILSAFKKPARTREKSGVEALVKFEVNDLFAADIHNATVVALYLLPDVNLRLRPKLLKDLKPGTRVVSHDFHMGDWKPEKHELVDAASNIYLWRIPGRIPVK